MSNLTRHQRQQILDCLARLTILDTRLGRDQLLAGLPPALADSIPRTDTKRLDLAALLDGCAAWRTLADPSPLQLLLENAGVLAAGTQIAAELRTLQQALHPAPI